MEDLLDGVPSQLFGYQLKTKTQIILQYLVPAIFELCIYIILTTADVALIVQYFHDNHIIWGALTLTFVILPVVLCFITIIASPTQWPKEQQQKREKMMKNERLSREDSYGNTEATTITKCVNCKFLLQHLFNLIIFPIASIYRYSYKIFWSIEALFHDKNSYNRYHAVRKAKETSSVELYHFLQAFTQAAPQIILQLYIVMRENVFRNYDTTVAQALSIIFSFIKLGITSMTYHRFESQHVVGREYPWYPEEHNIERISKLNRSTSRPETLSSPKTPTWTPTIDFNLENIPKENDSHLNEVSSDALREMESNENLNATDEDKIESHKNKIQIVKADISTQSTSSNTAPDEIDSEVELRSKHSKRFSYTNIADEDLLDHIEDMKSYLKRQGDTIPSTPSEKSELLNFDRIPSLPPPPRPTSLYIPPFTKLSKIKDMIIFDTQNMIKNNVPHLPPGLFKDHDKQEPSCETDFIMPTRKRTINGLEQDDILGKYVCFIGWLLFLVMRMLAIATFSVFYPLETLYLCIAHYMLMLLCIYYETRSLIKLHRTLFYLFLAYIYIFCLIEFKIKFFHIKTWYFGYFFVVFTENLIITMIWYLTELFYSWWFDLMWNIIITSAILSVSCHVFYYFVLRPRDKVLFVNDNEQE